MKPDKTQKKNLRIAIGILLFITGLFLRANEALSFALFLSAFLISGSDVILKAFRGLSHGFVLDENFLMAIAAIGAFIIKEYPEGVAVMLFYQTGELFQSYAVDKSRKSISSLMDIRPDYANVWRGEELLRVAPASVKPGDLIVVRSGEKVPLDSVITDGNSSLDTSALTGESLPRGVAPGDLILSGCINLTGLITARVSKEYGESTVSKILDLVENASSKKSESENFITKFARYYTPAVVGTAVLLAIIPPLLIKGAVFTDWIYRALLFLVVSCPCALVISVPLSFFGGIGGASKCGILVKGGNYLEALSKVKTVVFDKTGTLTKGFFSVSNVSPLGITKEALLKTAAYAESYSNHPISLSLLRAYGKPIDSSRVSEAQEISGHGIKAVVDGKQILAGNSKLMKLNNINSPQSIPDSGTIVHVAESRKYLGYITFDDELKADSQKTIKKLKEMGMEKIVMLTGDSKLIGEKVARQLGIDNVYSELLPSEKVDKIEELLNKSPKSGNLIFVGDGINDAPVLARADIGMAMGALGSDAAIEAADIVIMTDEPSKVVTAINIAKRTLLIAKQNIVFALGVKLIVLIMGALGYATMWEAVFADVGVSVIAILNAMRALNTKKY
ncbi:MAG: heavy metal translocating P-type ATPase [Lachnospiraceae bacterium]|nr:heavy metal translocating P-type ATPase [Lachnospiraceae bacterium]